jgi:hypothetical protein
LASDDSVLSKMQGTQIWFFAHIFKLAVVWAELKAFLLTAVIDRQSEYTGEIGISAGVSLLIRLSVSDLLKV